MKGCSRPTAKRPAVTISYRCWITPKSCGKRLILSIATSNSFWIRSKLEKRFINT
nr:MAG TPA: hypothetical protein [Caudoviricetes sp.]